MYTEEPTAVLPAVNMGAAKDEWQLKRCAVDSFILLTSRASYGLGFISGKVLLYIEIRQNKECEEIPLPSEKRPRVLKKKSADGLVVLNTFAHLLWLLAKNKFFDGWSEEDVADEVLNESG